MSELQAVVPGLMWRRLVTLLLGWGMLFGAVMNPVTAQTTKAQFSSAARNLSGVWWIENYDPELRPNNGMPLPFTPAGQIRYQTILDQTAAGKLTDPTLKGCVPEGLPRVMNSPYPMQIVQSEGYITMIHEVNHTFWTIILNGNHPDADDLDPTFMGHSIGHWDGDTLVVDTLGFKPRGAVDATGIPHSARLHVVQRLRKLSAKQLEVVMTIEDPVMFTQTWSVRRTYELRPDVQIMEWPCGEPHRYLPDLRAKHYYYQSGAVVKGVPKDAAMAYFEQMAADQATARSQIAKLAQDKKVKMAPPDFTGKWGVDRRAPGTKGPAYTLDNADLSYMQLWAEAEVQQRKAAVKAGQQVPLNNIQCMLDGMPFLTQEAHPVMIRQTRDQLIFMFEADHQLRYIHLNAEHPVNLQPSYYGHSIGHWDGDTLVIDTVGMNDKSQLDFDGGPHSEAMHIIERMRFIEGNQRFEIQTTLEDPIVLKRPWTYKLIFNRDKKEGALSNEYVCAENNRDAR